MLLEAREIVKRYADRQVLHGVSFGASEGAIVCLLGPSGCGKSTLLRVIAGLEADYTGSVLFADQPIDRVPVHRRGFGFMFQEYALLPHRSVGQNIAFGLRMQRMSRQAIAERVDQMLDLVGLPAYADRTIFQLSGGERQRVALARSLAPQPRLLMLDEPLGALDRTLRERLTDDLREIIKRVGLTSIYVTHDQVEAFAVADQIVLMERGNIVQQGTPLEVYRHPATPFAARFLGLNNLIAATPQGRSTDQIAFQTPLGTLQVTDTTHAVDRSLLLIRPEAAEPAVAGAPNIIEGQVIRSSFRGGTQRVILCHISGIELELDFEAGMPAGDLIRVSLRPDALTLITSDE